jgi:ethanolamine transporter EutH
MRKVTLIFGSIAGVIVSAFFVIGVSLCENDKINLDSSELLGYASMVIALSMIFFGIKSFRDNYQNGVIKFGKGLQVGLLISLVASLIYAAAGEVYYQVNPDSQLALMDKMADYHVNRMKEKGASSVEIDQTAKQMADMKQMFKNPLLRFGMTLAIILPVGIVITLVSAAVLRKKEFLAAQPLG